MVFSRLLDFHQKVVNWLCNLHYYKRAKTKNNHHKIFQDQEVKLNCAKKIKGAKLLNGAFP